MALILRICSLKGEITVRRWIRVSDEGGKPRNFGFCEYETFEGVLGALTTLHELSITHPDDRDKTSKISVCITVLNTGPLLEI